MRTGRTKLSIVVATAAVSLVAVVACGEGTSDPVAIDVDTDLSYGPEPFGTLDVYAPSDAGPWPVAIVAHGFSQRRGDFKELSRAIAEQGVVVYNVDYDTVHPPITGINNVTCAVRYLHETASDYDGDDERVTFVGSSQGAVTGLIVALVGEQFGQGCQVPDGDATIDAFVGYEGPYNWAHVRGPMPAVDVAALESTEPGVWSAVDPYTHIGGNFDLEVHLVHGDDNDVAWYEIARSVSEELRDELVEAGYDAELTLIDGSHLALGSEYEVGFDRVVELAVEMAKG